MGLEHDPASADPGEHSFRVDVTPSVDFRGVQVVPGQRDFDELISCEQCLPSSHPLLCRGLHETISPGDHSPVPFHPIRIDTRPKNTKHTAIRNHQRQLASRCCE